MTLYDEARPRDRLPVRQLQYFAQQTYLVMQDMFALHINPVGPSEGS